MIYWLVFTAIVAILAVMGALSFIAGYLVGKSDRHTAELEPDTAAPKLAILEKAVMPLIGYAAMIQHDWDGGRKVNDYEDLDVRVEDLRTLWQHYQTINPTAKFGGSYWSYSDMPMRPLPKLDPVLDARKNKAKKS